MAPQILGAVVLVGVGVFMLVNDEARADGIQPWFVLLRFCFVGWATWLSAHLLASKILLTPVPGAMEPPAPQGWIGAGGGHRERQGPRVGDASLGASEGRAPNLDPDHPGFTAFREAVQRVSPGARV